MWDKVGKIKVPPQLLFEVADSGLRQKRAEIPLEARFRGERVIYTSWLRKCLYGLKKGQRIDSGKLQRVKGRAKRAFPLFPRQKGQELVDFLGPYMGKGGRC